MGVSVAGQIKETPSAVENYACQSKNMRALAERAISAEVKEQLLRLAELYEKLANVTAEFDLRPLSAAGCTVASRASDQLLAHEFADQLSEAGTAVADLGIRRETP